MVEERSGISKEIYYDKKIKRLNFELAIDKQIDEMPVVLIQDWTEKDSDKEETLITLHLKELIEIKAIIDEIVFDYLAYEKDTK